MTWQQFLTEKVLGECWHERANPGNTEQPRCTCGVGNDSAFALNEGHIFKVRRTFKAEADMMALYRVIAKAGKWEAFYARMTGKFIVAKQNCNLPHCQLAVWLFCLSGEGYEERCKMVAEFMGWKEDAQ